MLRDESVGQCIYRRKSSIQAGIAKKMLVWEMITKAGSAGPLLLIESPSDSDSSLARKNLAEA